MAAQPMRRREPSKPIVCMCVCVCVRVRACEGMCDNGDIRDNGRIF